jgi:uncharacterized membrane protein SpoIIM required for sporulation
MSDTYANDVDANGMSASARATIRLKSSEFRAQREDGWKELESYIERTEKRGIRALRADELQRLSILYRAALSSLSVARSIALDRNMLLYLENLTLRAFLVVYGPRKSLGESFSNFLFGGFPAAVRSAGVHILITFMSLVFGSLAGFFLVTADSEWFASLVPSWLAGGRGPETSADELRKVLFAPPPSFGQSLAVMASFLFQNNTMVGILSFSLGIAAGVPTLALIFYQGLIMGAFIAIHYRHGLTFELLGWLSIHGVTEILAIILCGAAGLVIAEKILFPGRYGRLESVSIHGRAAAQIALGSVILFFVAAILEGVFRQAVSDTNARFLVGGVSGILWLSYFLLARRKVSEQ